MLFVIFMLFYSITFAKVVQAYETCLRYPPPKSSSSGGGLTITSFQTDGYFYVVSILSFYFIHLLFIQGAGAELVPVEYRKQE